MPEATYEFSQNQIDEYRTHGSVCAEINKMIPVPLSRCSIDVSPLVKIEHLQYAWIARHEPEAPAIIIASNRWRSIPESALQFDLRREPSSLLVKMWYKHPSGSYEAELEPVYEQ